jgi:Ca-activated chloride channel homolog
MMRLRALIVALLVAAGGSLPYPAAAQDAESPAQWEAVVAWPEEQRAFLQDGPGWLLDGGQVAALLAMDEAARQRWIDDFLSRDPLPETPENELAAGIAARRAALIAAYTSPSDVRSRLLFLHGPPAERLVLDCGQAFRPIEIWSFGEPGRVQRTGAVDAVLVYQSAPGSPWRLWLPQHGKRVLYTQDMEHWLEDWEELTGSGFMRAERFDLQVCRRARRVDRVTGVKGLADADRTRPRAEDYQAFLHPPTDLAAWARVAAATPVESAAPELALGDLTVRFPRREGQRLVSRFVVELPPGAAEAAVREGRVGVSSTAWDAAFEEDGAEDAGDGSAADPPAATEEVGREDEVVAGADSGAHAADRPEADAETEADPDAERELRLVVEGLVERDGGVLDTFRVRFRPDAPAEGQPVALVVDRPLRPNASYLVRLAVRDEVSGRSGRVTAAFRVPATARPEDAAEPREDLVVALGEDLAREAIPGADHLLLVPPEETVVLGLWRAEALVSGSRIARVAFLVDGEVQMTRSRPPYTAELRLDRFPREQVVGAIGYDADGEVVAADEVVVNQPRGELRVRIVEPPRGIRAAGRLTARAEITVPDGRRVERVEIEVNDRPAAVLERPPWAAPIEVPAGGELVYLSITAWLDDGRQAEDVRILNAPGYMEEVDVSLVELYVAAVDRGNLPVPGLTVGDFRVLEDGRPQEIRRFEEVEDLPLAVGLVIDTSGSMQDSLAEAQRAAEGFLRSVVRPGDTAFALAFSSQPVLLVPPTDDVDAVADALSGLRADGWTVLHDALVTALYYFRGIEGQKAMVLLSDGDDTTSTVPFEDALEYARRMNTAVYTIGLNVGRLNVPVRRKLEELARSTGGRSFFVGQASELEGIYEVIEKELRSRYLLSYSSDRARSEGEGFRGVAVEVAKPGVTGRTIKGYYP